MRAFQASRFDCTLTRVWMSDEKLNASGTERFRALSSIHDDVWHAEKKAGAYEWWYFDAVSDDGRETLIVIFLDGFIFSPRYNRHVKERLHVARDGSHDSNNASSPGDFPAVAISLYRDGRLMWRAINEYEACEFAARRDRPECRIGSNSFELEKRTGENIYRLQLDSVLRGGRRLQASLAWSVQEGNFSPNDRMQTGDETSAHEWNLVAPKCRVTGTISIIESGGARGDERRWTGTGYHDHNLDTRWMPATIAEWQWGRAHFADATAIFYRYKEQGDANVTTRLYIVRNNELKIYEPQFSAGGWRRHFFGLRYPRAIEMSVDEDGRRLSLRVEQRKIVDSSFFYLRFTGEAQLDLGDGRLRRAVVVAEKLAPRALQWRALWWLTGLRIGRGERHSFLP